MFFCGFEGFSMFFLMVLKVFDGFEGFEGFLMFFLMVLKVF